MNDNKQRQKVKEQKNKNINIKIKRLLFTQKYSLNELLHCDTTNTYLLETWMKKLN